MYPAEMYILVTNFWAFTGLRPFGVWGNHDMKGRQAGSNSRNGNIRNKMITLFYHMLYPLSH